MAGFNIKKSKTKAHHNRHDPKVVQAVGHLNLRWPRDEKRQELDWLQANYEFLTKLQAKLFAVYEDMERQHTHKGVHSTSLRYRVVKMMWESWPGAIEMTKAWALHVNGFAWSGSRAYKPQLSNYILNDKKTWHREWFQEQFANYTGSGDNFDSVFWTFFKGA